jgi:hypothetical protein
LLEIQEVNPIWTMSELLVWIAVAAACFFGCGFFKARQRGRLHKIQAIRTVTIEKLPGLQ